MALVPAGEFTMGSDLSAPVESPPHTVLLDAFYMDLYETSTSQYKECVTAGFCLRPWTDTSATRPGYFSNPEFADYPVIHVDWNMANAYCEWRDKRLPTEAEWEKAARGEDGLTYPWGNEFDGSRLNFCDVNCLNFPNTDYDDSYNDTAPVDTYPLGVSVYGIYNLAGNVREWVQDEYNVYPGGNPAASADFGAGLYVVRGGSWNENHIVAESFHRFAYAPDAVGDNTGFRCVVDAAP
jgi:formylglycine-generating enzyme required for sulfatase activity